MKTFLQVVLFFIVIIFCTATVNAQKTLIHYWNFNTLAGPYTHPAIPHIAPDYSAMSPDTAYLEYYLLPGTSATWAISGNDANNASGAQIDNVASTDTSNLRNGATSGLGLRARNPTDSGELHWHIPSTGFKDLVVKFATESSSIASGDSTQVYSYSVDGGKTWDSTGMTVNGAPGHILDLTQGGNANSIYLGFAPVTITFGSDLTVNNNPNLIFRIVFRGNTHPGYPVTGSNQVSGNNRFDNFTLDGVSTGVVKPPPAVITVLTPATDALLEVGRQIPITFTTFSEVGEQRTIQLSTDGGTTWQTTPITTLTGGTSYQWTVPNSPTTKGMIRVTDSANVTGKTGLFSIVAIPSPNVIVHYWNFNTINGQFNNPSIPAFPSDFSANLNNIGSIQYVNLGSKGYIGYIDNVAGDTVNTLLGSDPGHGFRVRNPTDSMELHFVIPTTGFKTISINYALQSSDSAIGGSAPHTEKFSYSTDDGNTWATAGMTVNGVAGTSLNVHLVQYGSTLTGLGAFGHVSIGGFPTAVDNNANFVFRIQFADSTHGNSGNNRLDNISVVGTPTGNSVASDGSNASQYRLYPNPSSSDRIMITTPSEGTKTVLVMDVTGRAVRRLTVTEQNFFVSTAGLAAGIYTVRIADVGTGNFSILKAIKE